MIASQATKKPLLLKKKYLHEVAKVDNKTVDPNQKNKQQMKRKTTLKKHAKTL
jgi:hypothetical protein